MGIQLTLAARYIRGRRLRAVLTTLAVVFGVLVIFGMNILIPTMMQALQSSMLAASDQVDMTATLRSGDPFPATTLEKLKGVDGLRAVQGIMGRQVNLPADFLDHDPKTPDRVNVLSLVGVDPATARDVRPYAVKDGRFLEPYDVDSAVISASLAGSLRLKLGDSLALPTAHGLAKLTIVGLRAPRALPGTEEVLVTLAEAQSLLAAPGQITSMEGSYVTADAARRAQIRAAVQTALGDRFTLDTLSTEGNLYASLQAGTIVMSAFGVLALFMGAFIIFNTFRTIVAERRRDIGMLRAIGASRRTIIGTIIAEGLFQGVLGTALGMALGYLLAAGAATALSPMLGQFVHVKLGLPVVSPGIAVVSVVLGVGVTLAAGLFPALSAGRVTPMEALRPVVDTAAYRRVLGGGAIAGIACIVVSLVALAAGSMSTLALGMVLFMTGLVLVAPALVRPLSLVFGALLAALFARHGTGTLAQNNLARQPSRAAVTASTTMIALAVIVAMGGFMVSVSDGFLGILRTSLGSDYLFVPPAVGLWQNNVGATGSFADALRGTQGVGAVSTLRYAAAIVDLPAGAGKAGGKAFGKASAKAPAMAPGAPTADESAASAGNTVSVLGIDPATFPLVSSLSFTDGKPGKAYADLAAGRSAILNPALAASLGLKSGALMTLQTPDGPREYRVTGVATDFLDAKIAAMFISQANLASDFHKTEDVLIQLNLKPGADAAAADTAIRAAGSDYPQFSIIQGKEYYNEMSRMFTAVFAMLYVLFGFLALPSLLTTLNTLAISVIERTREIGMLRAVGTTKKQVSRTVLAEGLLLAAIGTAFGLLAGLYLGFLLVKAMASAGFPVMYIFPWGGIASAVIVGLLFGALAAIIPSRKAAGLEIVQALRYE